MKSSASPGRISTKRTANSCRTENHGAPKRSLPRAVERFASGAAPARQPADDVFFRHLAALCLSLLLRSRAGESCRHGAGIAVARFPFHRHPRPRSAISLRTRKPLPRRPAALAARPRRVVSCQKLFQSGLDGARRNRRHPALLDPFQLALMEFATAVISGYLTWDRRLLRPGNDHVGDHFAGACP